VGARGSAAASVSHGDGLAARVSELERQHAQLAESHRQLRDYVASIDSAQSQSQAVLDRVRPNVDILWQQAARYDSHLRLRQRVDRMEWELHQTQGYAVALQQMNPPAPQFGPTVAMDWSRGGAGALHAGVYPRSSHDSYARSRSGRQDDSGRLQEERRSRRSEASASPPARGPSEARSRSRSRSPTHPRFEEADTA
jgi:hypothetical protein